MLGNVVLIGCNAEANNNNGLQVRTDSIYVKKRGTNRQTKNPVFTGYFVL